MNVAAYSLTIGADLSSVYVTKTINLALNKLKNTLMEMILLNIYIKGAIGMHTVKRKFKPIVINSFIKNLYLRENIGDL